MTDKEILQGIDKLEDGIPFDEIRNGDKWLDIHELLYEVRERIKWHYPSRGEYPTEDGNYLVVLELEDNPNCCMRCIKFYNPKTRCFDTVCRVVAWMPLPDPPKEEV